VTEPREIAESVEQVAEGVWHWRIRNANIGGGISSSHAVATETGCVLIDPVRLAPEALASLPPPEAILLNARTHQRAAWRYRRELGIEVWLADDAPAAEEEPDHRYTESDTLPGGLDVIRTPGPEWPHYSFLLRREPGVLFCSDLLMDAGGTLAFVPLEFHDDPEETRRSVERLLDLDFTILCLDHGAPLSDDPKAAIRSLLWPPPES
jgi:glyoxylase-like metal-dependent hydrolase (beta-lactamase superfamily II)